MCYLYKQVVLGSGIPSLKIYDLDDSMPVRNTRRSAALHDYRVRVDLSRHDTVIYRRHVKWLQRWNDLPASVFDGDRDCQSFKKRLTEVVRDGSVSVN
jgi:hypothetical protein